MSNGSLHNDNRGASNIITHARDVDGSVRRKESKRKKERERRKRKKEEERKRKQEEMSRARNQKMKEIVNRLKEIQAITGNEGRRPTQIERKRESLTDGSCIAM